MAAFTVGSRVEETRYGAVQNDRWHGIPGDDRPRPLKQGKIIKLSSRFWVSGYDALIAWDDGTNGSRVADTDHLVLIQETKADKVKPSPAPRLEAIAVRAEQETVRSFAEDHGIDSLVHFTRADRLPLIIREGVLSNKRLSTLGRTVLDKYRYDGKADHVCLSVSFPNYQMFYSYTQGNTVEWCVIVLDARILWEQNCLYYPYNAATSDLAGRPVADFQGVKALRNIYAQIVQGRERSKSIPPAFPTSPQAEVLVPGSVPASSIMSVEFSSSQTKLMYQSLLDSNAIRSVLSLQYFAPRVDWEQWRKS
jgi:hypothetical protein